MSMRRIAWIGAFLLLAECATALEGQRELSKATVSVDKERMSAVRLKAPWGGDDAWSYRYPETIQSNKGLLYIDHRLPDGNSRILVCFLPVVTISGFRPPIIVSTTGSSCPRN